MSIENRIGFELRLKAVLIDLFYSFKIGLIVGIPLGLITLFIVNFISNSWSGFPVKDIGFWLIVLTIIGGVIVFVCFGLLLTISKFFYLDVKKGATPGKRKLGIQIKNQDGTPATTQVLLVRASLKYGGFILIFLPFVLPFLILFQPLGLLLLHIALLGNLFVLGTKKQSLIEMITKTAVYSEK